MENYLLDGCGSFLNNLAEDTIIETIKANRLNVFKYLRHLLQEISNMYFQNKPEILDQLCLGMKVPKKYVDNSRTKVRLNISNFSTAILF